MSSSRPPSIDPQAAARWAAHVPASAPWLHEEVGRRMAERLDFIKLQPRAWLDWAPLTGGLAVHATLADRYPTATPHVLEATPAREAAVRAVLRRPWWQATRWRRPATVYGPAADGVDMLWANMALHTHADPEVLIARWHGLLATDGFLMLSCLGPDSLVELRRLYAALGWPPPGHDLTDMHDWGDMLVRAGFAEPVMDMERITLTYATPESLLDDLRSMGRNLHRERAAVCRGRRWRTRLLEALGEQLGQGRNDGQLALTFEVNYGHALKPAPRAVVAGQTAVPLDDMRAMLRRPPSR